MTRACDACLARTWLLGRLAGHLDLERARVDALLALDDGSLISAVGGTEARAIAQALVRCDGDAARQASVDVGLELLCRCDRDYPSGLLQLDAPPAVLHVAGGLERFVAFCEQDPVAVVGSRNASEYGVEVSRGLGRGLSAAGVTVVSGLARGIDSAAHQGALAVDGPTIAVLPGPADRPYPASQRKLHSAIRTRGAAVSEVAPGTGVRRWMFPARNRMIAALSELTVVVEARTRSGSLLTAEYARWLGRAVGAVPGRVTTRQAEGSNALLAGGAGVIRDAQDVLDRLFGFGERQATPDDRAEPTSGQQALLRRIASGEDTVAALGRSGLGVEHGLADLAALELAGWVRRGVGGRITVVP